MRRGAQHAPGDAGVERTGGGADSLIAELVLDHLYRLTDNTGIYQHAKYTRPNPEFGYCLDDNARALIVAIRAHALLGDNGLLDYVRHYLAFVERCQRSDGRFHNFMSATGEWLDDIGSEDSQGRAIWALGFAARHSAQTEIRARGLACLDRALPWLVRLTALRAWAYVLLGVKHWCAAEPAPVLDGLTAELSRRLAAAYAACSSPDWRWFEPELTYCNARLPEALLDSPHSQLGLEALEWLCGVVQVDGAISLIGNHGWYRRGGPRAKFDQQAVDAAALVSACRAAYDLSGDERFRASMLLAQSWFLGKNDAGSPLVDEGSGGCFDGLEENGVNQNQGAESLLSWLMAEEDRLEAGF